MPSLVDCPNDFSSLPWVRDPSTKVVLKAEGGLRLKSKDPLLQLLLRCRALASDYGSRELFAQARRSSARVSKSRQSKCHSPTTSCFCRYLMQQALQVELQQLLQSCNCCLEACGSDLLCDMALKRGGFSFGHQAAAAVQQQLTVSRTFQKDNSQEYKDNLHSQYLGFLQVQRLMDLPDQSTTGVVPVQILQWQSPYCASADHK